MAKAPATSSIGTESESDGQRATNEPICGVIMPISADDNYPEEHWRRVQRIIVRAIERAQMKPKMVWENPEIDVIHSKILQNIYECDVVVCDISSLNPNVMLELGLRLSTKRPTVVITDGIKKPPFDITVYQYHSYQSDLEYNALDAFITELGAKIRQVLTAHKDGKYKSFVENFTFEVVKPTQVTVPAEEAIRDRIDIIARQIARIDARLPDPSKAVQRPRQIFLSFEHMLGDNEATLCAKEILVHPAVNRIETDNTGFTTKMNVYFDSNLSAVKVDLLKTWVQSIIDKNDVPF